MRLAEATGFGFAALPGQKGQFLGAAPPEKGYRMGALSLPPGVFRYRRPVCFPDGLCQHPLHHHADSLQAAAGYCAVPDRHRRHRGGSLGPIAGVWRGGAD